MMRICTVIKPLLSDVKQSWTLLNFGMYKVFASLIILQYKSKNKHSILRIHFSFICYPSACNSKLDSLRIIDHCWFALSFLSDMFTLVLISLNFCPDSKHLVSC